MSENKEYLLSLLPDHLSALRQIQVIADVEGRKFDEIDEISDDIFDQFFVQTATWGLKYWEERYLLPVLNENTDYESRRIKILAAKRSSKSKLIDILLAAEPSITCGWGGLTLPFYIQTSEYDYDFSKLIPILEKEKPAHLSYSFTVNPNGYTVKSFKLNRHSNSLILISGTSQLGVWPRRNSAGQSKRSETKINSHVFSGLGIFKKTGKLFSGGEEKTTSDGAVKVSNIRFDPLTVTGIGKSFPCGIKYSGQEVA